MSEDTIVPSGGQIQTELASVRTNEARHHPNMIDGQSARTGVFRERFAVLDNLREKIRECYLHVEACEREAAAQTDPALRKDFLDTAARWLKRAQRYEFEQRLTR
ncbi:MAG TPA: hypothetical protein VGJ20_37045 [Xanthobacteraceae bacterium]|jgi:hypothetical protein